MRFLLEGREWEEHLLKWTLLKYDEKFWGDCNFLRIVPVDGFIVNSVWPWFSHQLMSIGQFLCFHFIIIIFLHFGPAILQLCSVLKVKAVPQHTCGGEGGERRYSSYSFTTWAPDGSEWSASRPGRAWLPSTHWTGGCLGPRKSLDSELIGKVLCLCWGSNLDRPVRSQTLYLLSYPGSCAQCSCYLISVSLYFSYHVSLFYHLLVVLIFSTSAFLICLLVSLSHTFSRFGLFMPTPVAPSSCLLLQTLMLLDTSSKLQFPGVTNKPLTYNTVFRGRCKCVHLTHRDWKAQFYVMLSCYVCTEVILWEYHAYIMHVTLMSR
jgi:hypothetical protein